MPGRNDQPDFGAPYPERSAGSICVEHAQPRPCSRCTARDQEASNQEMRDRAAERAAATLIAESIDLASVDGRTLYRLYSTIFEPALPLAMPSFDEVAIEIRQAWAKLEGAHMTACVTKVMIGFSEGADVDALDSADADRARRRALTVDRPSFLCSRVADMPEPAVPSIQRACSRCNQKVWVDKKVEGRLSGLAVTCAPCAFTRAEERAEEEASR